MIHQLLRIDLLLAHLAYVCAHVKMLRYTRNVSIIFRRCLIMRPPP